MKYLLSLALLLLTSSLWADLQLPETVQGEVGDFVRIPATTEGAVVRWVVLDKGLALFPLDLLKDTKTAVVIGKVPGKYRMLAYTSIKDVPSEPALCVVIIKGEPAPESIAPAKQSAEQAVRQARRAVVSVHVQTGGTAWKMASGAIVSTRGVVITNQHVVAGAQRILVRLMDGTEYPADVLATDPTADLALLSIPGHGRLTALPLSSADALAPSEVWAIGHPLGYTWTISRGVLSAGGRTVPLPNGTVLHGALQTTAVVATGSSGGPLLNGRGEIVGIIAAYHDGANGIAFAVSAAKVKVLLAKNLSK